MVFPRMMMGQNAIHYNAQIGRWHVANYGFATTPARRGRGTSCRGASSTLRAEHSW